MTHKIEVRAGLQQKWVAPAPPSLHPSSPEVPQQAEDEGTWERRGQIDSPPLHRRASKQGLLDNSTTLSALLYYRRQAGWLKAAGLFSGNS